jgi:hypothetical protein
MIPALRRIFFVLVVAVATASRAATPQQIDDSIQRAKSWLYSQQSQGTWEKTQKREPTSADRSSGQSITDGQWGGTTALATYALLAAGESPQEPRLQQAIDFLKKADLVGVYALGMRMQVWSFLPQTSEIKQLVRRDAQLLSKLMHWDGRHKGFYDYTDTKRNYSLSRSQYGVLGMWTAAQLGAEVPRNYWQTVETAWLNLQRSDGSWRYIERDQYVPTPGITAVGVATLFITQDYLHANKGASCNGNITNPAIEKGLDWMASNFDKIATDERYDRDYPYFTLYAVERIGVASGLKHFRGIDWYQRGADWLIEKQAKSGSWSSAYGPVANTSMALLFLARGRDPIAINKLRYQIDGQEGHWNQRPREIANVTRWIGRSVEREFNWQIVNLDMPVRDLHEAPILYIGGSQDIKLSDEHKEKLKAFIEGGGLLLANADCQARAYQGAIRRLGSELFPQYEFRELPADHLIYTAQQFPRENWRTKPSVLGMSNGVRELILFLPQQDAAKTWQLQVMPGRDQDWQLPANILMYATDRHPLRKRGEHYLVERDEKSAATKTIKLARLKYDGNWDPEPGGWRRLANVLYNEYKIELLADPVEIASISDAEIAHLTGTAAVQFTPAQQGALKKYVEGGGTLLIDAAGGSADFAKSAEALIEQLFPKALKALPADHAVYSAGGKTAEIQYRAYAQRMLGAASGGRLQGIEQDGRVVLVYSREDLSTGLVGQPVDGIVGYAPASATQLMSRIVRYTAGK